MPGDQLRGRALVHDLAVAHRDDPLAQRFGLVELVRDQQDGGAGVAQLGHRTPHLATRGRVETLGQLVEDHQPRAVEQRQHEEQPLSLATAQPGVRRPPQVLEPELLQQRAPVARPRPGEEGDRLRDPQPVRQTRALQLAADLRPQPVGVMDRIEAEHAELAGVGPAEPLEALDGGGLAGAVGADQAEHLAGVHVQVEAIDDGAAAVRLGEPADP